MARVAVVGHDRIFLRIMIERQLRKFDAVSLLNDVSVLETTQVVADLVHEGGGESEIAEHRIGVVVAIRVGGNVGEPAIAPRRGGVRRINGVGLCRAVAEPWDVKARTIAGVEFPGEAKTLTCSP